ncbi:MAG: hypothetical protein MJ156_00105 [Alphaproteobacteria bacterium]|nr:hypothetical protein [Alphaproteobacteria bacterium]
MSIYIKKTGKTAAERAAFIILLSLKDCLFFIIECTVAKFNEYSIKT